MGSLIAKKGSRCFSWQFVFKDLTGKSCLKSLSTGVEIPDQKRLYKEAEAQARIEGKRREEAFTQQFYATGSLKDHSGDTLEEYASYYIDYMTTHRIKVTDSISQPASLLRNYIVPKIGHVKLKDINYDIIDQFLFEEIDACKKRADKGLEPHYGNVKRMHATLCSLLSHAKKRKYVAHNVAKEEEYDILKQIPKKQTVKAPTFDEVTAILNAVQGTTIESVVMIMGLYGLRRSEALGLRNCNVDSTMMRIRDTIVKLDSKNHAVTEEGSAKAYAVRYGVTKSVTSARNLPLNKFMAEYLQKLAARKAEYKELMGNGYNDEGFVCCKANGEHFTPDAVSRQFARILKRNGLPHFSLEKLRNAVAAEILNRTGNTDYVGLWLGHAPKNVSIGSYFDPTIPNLRRIADALQEAAEERFGGE